MFAESTDSAFCPTSSGPGRPLLKAQADAISIAAMTDGALTGAQPGQSAMCCFVAAVLSVGPGGQPRRHQV